MGSALADPEIWERTVNHWQRAVAGSMLKRRHCASLPRTDGRLAGQQRPPRQTCGAYTHFSGCSGSDANQEQSKGEQGTLACRRHDNGALEKLLMPLAR